MKSDHELELDGAFNSLKAFSSYKYNHLTFYIEDLYHIFNTRPEYNQQDFIRILNESDRSNKYNAEIPAAYKLAVVNYFWDVFSNILFERIPEFEILCIKLIDNLLTIEEFSVEFNNLIRQSFDKTINLVSNRILPETVRKDSQTRELIKIINYLYTVSRFYFEEDSNKSELDFRLEVINVYLKLQIKNLEN